MTMLRCAIPALTVAMKLSRLGLKNVPVLGMLDNWAALYPGKRLALKTVELIVHDRMSDANDHDRLQGRDHRL